MPTDRLQRLVETTQAIEAAKAAMAADPEGQYDYESAIEWMEQSGHSLRTPDGHWASVVPSGPKQGLILKSPDHPTYDKTVQRESELGHTMYQRMADGRRREFTAPALTVEPEEERPKPKHAALRALIHGQQEQPAEFPIESPTGLTGEQWNSPRAGLDDHTLERDIANNFAASRELGRGIGKVVPEKGLGTAFATGLWTAANNFRATAYDPDSYLGDIVGYYSIYLWGPSGLGILTEEQEVEAYEAYLAEGAAQTGYATGVSEGTAVPQWSPEGIAQMAGGSAPATAAAVAGASVGTFVAPGPGTAAGAALAFGAVSGGGVGWAMGESAAKMELDQFEAERNAALQAHGHAGGAWIPSHVRSDIIRTYAQAEAGYEMLGSLAQIGAGLAFARRLATNTARHAGGSALRTAVSQTSRRWIVSNGVRGAVMRSGRFLAWEVGAEAATEGATEITQTRAMRRVDPDKPLEFWNAVAAGATLGALFSGGFAATGAAVGARGRSAALKAINRGLLQRAAHTRVPLEYYRERYPDHIAALEEMDPEQRQQQILLWEEQRRALEDEYQSKVEARKEEESSDPETATRLLAESNELRNQIDQVDQHIAMVREVQMGLQESVEIATLTPDKVMASKRNRNGDVGVKRARATNKQQKKAESQINKWGYEVVWYENTEWAPPAFYDPRTPGVVYMAADQSSHSSVFLALGVHEVIHDLQYYDPGLYRSVREVLGDAEVMYEAGQYAAADNVAEKAHKELTKLLKNAGLDPALASDPQAAMEAITELPKEKQEQIRETIGAMVRGWKDLQTVRLVEHLSKGGTLENFTEATTEEQRQAETYAEQEGAAKAIERGMQWANSRVGRLFTRLGMGGRRSSAAMHLMNSLQKAAAKVQSRRQQATESGRAGISELGGRIQQDVSQQFTPAIEEGFERTARARHLGETRTVPSAEVGDIVDPDATGAQPGVSLPAKSVKPLHPTRGVAKPDRRRHLKPEGIRRGSGPVSWSPHHQENLRRCRR